MKTKLLILFTVSVFMFVVRFAVADVIKEPNIITINNQLLVYEEVAEKIIANAKANGLNVKRSDKEVTIEVKGDNNLLVKVIKMYNEAKKSGWVFDECEDGIEGKNLGIDVDKKKKLVKDIVLCSI